LKRYGRKAEGKDKEAGVIIKLEENTQK